MNKWRLAIVGVLLMSTLSAFCAIDARTNEDEANSMRQARSADMWFEKWSFKMSRGVINAGSFWVELPRCIYTETADNPLVGPLKGTFKGLGLSFVRAVAAVMDLATFGTVDDTFTVYDRYSFSYFVWQDWSSSDRK